MSLLKRKSYVKCKPNEDRTGVRCVAYRPGKSPGENKVIATAEFNLSPDGEIDTLAHDGDVEEIENLTKHASHFMKRKHNSSGDF